MISNLTMYGLQAKAPDWQTFFKEVGKYGIQYTMAAYEQQSGIEAKKATGISPTITPEYLGQPGTIQYPFLTMPEVLNPEQALVKGIEIPEGWFVKLTPDKSEQGYSVVYIGPDKSEVPEGQLFQDEAGVWLTPTEVTARQAASDKLDELTGLVAGALPDKDKTNILQWAQENPEEYANALAAEGQNPQTEVLLRYTVPGITDAQIHQIFNPSTVPTLDQQALVARAMEVWPDKSIEEVLDYATNSRDAFLKDIAAFGYTPATETLLSQIFPGMTAPQKDWMFKTDTEKVAWLEETGKLGVQRNEVVKTAIPGITDEDINTIYGNLSLASAKSPIDSGFGPQQESGVYNWGDTTMPLGGLKPVSGGDLLAPFKDALGILNKYVDRPWEVAVMQAQASLNLVSGVLGQGMVGQVDPLDDAVTKKLQENRDKYGFWGALVSEDVPDIWNDFAATLPGGKFTTTALSFLNPVYLIPVGGSFGLAAKFTSKIPIIGESLMKIAGGVQAIEKGVGEILIVAPIKGAAKYTGKALEAVGKEIGDVAVAQLIKDSGHLLPLMELPSNEKLLTELLAPNWMRTVVQTAAKVPAIKTGIEVSLGKRILIEQGVKDVENAMGQSAVIKGAIDRMGVDAASLKVNELAAPISDDRGFFGFTDNAYSEMMAKRILPEYKAAAEAAGPEAAAQFGTLEHIFQKPDMYDWTGIEQGLTYIERVKEVNQKVTALLIKEGVDPKVVTEDYLKRIVEGYTDTETGKFIPVKGQPGIKSTSLGGKPAYEMHRQFETMADGIAAGYRYGQSMRTSTSAYIQEAFRKIGDERALTEMSSQLGKLGMAPRTVKEIVAGQYPDLVAKWGAIKTEAGALGKAQALVNQAIRGENIPGQTIDALKRLGVEIPFGGTPVTRSLGERLETALALTGQNRTSALRDLSADIKQAIGSRNPTWYQTRGELTAKTELARQPTLTEGYIRQAFAGGKKYDQEAIDAFNKFFGYTPGRPELQATADIAGVLRLTKASLDFSAMSIQGLPSWGLAHATLLSDPATGVKMLGEWYKAYGYSIRAFFDPETLSKYIAKDIDSEMGRIAATGSSRVVDYFSALEARTGLGGLAEKGLSKIPLKPFERANQSFYAGGEVVRNEFWKIMSPKAIAQGKEIELAQFLDRLTGLADSRAGMVPLTARQLEQTFAWFAPNYTRSCLTLLADIFRGGMTGTEARKALGGMLGAGAAFYSATVYSMALLEGATDEQAMDRMLAGFGFVQDPITGDWSWKTSSTFMTLPIGNYNFGFGGFWYGLTSLASNIGQSLQETGGNKRTDFLALDRDNPLVQWWYNRSSPLVGAVSSLVGKNPYFLGDPLESPAQFGKYVLSLMEPIWMEGGINPLIPKLAEQYEVPEGTLAKIATPIGQILGLRVNPDFLWTKFYDAAKPLIARITDDMMAQYTSAEELPKYLEARDNGTLGWANLPKLLQEQLKMLYPDLTAKYNLALDDSKKRDSDLWKSWTADMADDKTIYYTRGDELWKQLLAGDKDTKAMRESWSDAGQMYGISIGQIERSSVYKAIYDELEVSQADGSKDSQYMDLALQDYQAVMFSDYLDAQGEWDWDAKDAAVQEFKDTWGEDVYQLIKKMYSDKKLREGLNPTFVRLADDKDLLNEYWKLPYATSDEKTARTDYLTNNPQADALLVLWGYRQNIQTKEAYDILVKEADELGIPLSRITGLPPEEIAPFEFEYNKMSAEYGAGFSNTAEAKLYLLDPKNKKYLNWTGRDLTDKNGELPNINVLKLQVKDRTQEAEYSALTTDEARQSYLAANPEYDADRIRITAYKAELPEAQVDTFVEWRQTDFKDYEDDWYLQEHGDFFEAAKAAKLISEETYSKEHFSKVPTKAVWALYEEYNTLPLGKVRVEFRIENRALDVWGKLVGKWSKLVSKGIEVQGPQTLEKMSLTETDVPGEGNVTSQEQQIPPLQRQPKEGEIAYYFPEDHDWYVGKPDRIADEVYGRLDEFYNEQDLSLKDLISSDKFIELAKKIGLETTVKLCAKLSGYLIEFSGIHGPGAIESTKTLELPVPKGINIGEYFYKYPINDSFPWPKSEPFGDMTSPLV